ncbi:type II secretion system secretin GspD [Rhodoferax sp.]|uniref:type II secretion system secretin GspD n=1 Tax=Rhodoferax sp. TaxID=50421 RepID=UPI003783BD5B
MPSAGARATCAAPSRAAQAAAALLLFASLIAALPQPVRAQAAAPAGGPVTLSFSNADIEAVARAMAAITGRQVVVDPRVKGTITLQSDKPLSPNAAYNQFLAALRLQGFTVVESGGLDKVVPEAEAKLQSGAVNAGALTGGGAGGSSQVMTQIFKLNFENASNLLPVLRPLISPNNVINVNPGNNSLIITDYADNLQRIARIIAASDVANGTEVEVISLKHAIASDLAPLVLRLADSSTPGAAAQGQTDNSFRTTLIAEPRSNSLILRAANPARVALVRSLVAKLDQPAVQGSAGTGNIHVVYLKNADATKLAATLRAVLSGEVRSPGTPSAGAGVGAGSVAASAAASPTSTAGQIQADVATNALIITAPDPQYRQLREVIRMLDARRAQVFVESLIVEVNAARAAEFGIQWQGPIGNTSGGTIGLLGTNFGTAGRNIISLSAQAGGVALPGNGLNVGVATQYTKGVYTLGFLARFLEANEDGNVLSTPNLLTLDNEEAKIVIGQNVPFVTGQYTNSGGGGNGATVTPFQTIERKDVGLTLKVKPQISESGTVKLSIFQEVSSVQSSSVNSSTGLITNKRSIESNVLVEDGAIVVLGGLLSDDYSGNDDRVPGLADIPIFGNLFKSESRSRKKTNLMVFLRPVVVRDAAGAEALSAGRYEQMRKVQTDAQPLENDRLPINAAPILPGPALAPPATGAPVPATGVPAAPAQAAPQPATSMPVAPLPAAPGAALPQ